jgi:hypothetical protein
MLKLKMSLATVLMLCALIIYGVILFLSVNFLPGANSNNLFTTPISYTLGLGVITYFLALVKRSTGKFVILLTIEWILLVLFIAMAIIFLPMFGHYFNVSKNKTQIQQSMLANLQKADSVWMNYDTHLNNRIQICESDMNAAFTREGHGLYSQQFHDFGFQMSVSQNVQINTQIGNLTNKLKPGDYAKDKQIDSVSIENAKRIVSDWNPLGLIRIKGILNHFANKANDFHTIDQFNLPGENKISSYTYTPNYEDTQRFFTSVTTPGLLPIIYALLLYILMLLPWLMAERNFRSQGLFFFLKKKEKMIDGVFTID